MIKNIKTKTIFKISIAVFALFLAMTYWQSIEKFIVSVLRASAPLIVGGCIAYALNILMAFYERHFFPKSKKSAVSKMRRPVSLILALISLIAVVTLITALIVPQLVSCVKLLIAEIPGAINFLMEWLENKNILSSDIAEKIAAIDWQSKLTQIFSALYSGVSNVMSIVVSAVTSVVSGIATAFVAIIFAIYLLMGKSKLSSQTKRLMKRYISSEKCSKIDHILAAVNSSFHKFIVGQCTEAVILGALCTVGMFILRLPYAPMIGAVIAFTALIPIVGAFIGGGVGAFLILMESPAKALIFIIFIIVLQQLEGNIIYPRVVGSSIGLPGIWVLTAVTVGGGVLGIPGMLIGVPLASAAYTLLRENMNKTPCEKHINEYNKDNKDNKANKN